MFLVIVIKMQQNQVIENIVDVTPIISLPLKASKLQFHVSYMNPFIANTINEMQCTMKAYSIPCMCIVIISLSLDFLFCVFVCGC